MYDNGDFPEDDKTWDDWDKDADHKLNFMAKLKHYLDIGAIQEAGIDENGEVVYLIDEVRTKELAPELWESHLEYIDRNLINLYKQGLMRVEYDENLDATLEFTPEGYEKAVEQGLIPLEDIDGYDIN